MVDILGLETALRAATTIIKIVFVFVFVFVFVRSRVLKSVGRRRDLHTYAHQCDCIVKARHLHMRIYRCYLAPCSFLLIYKTTLAAPLRVVARTGFSRCSG